MQTEAGLRWVVISAGESTQNRFGRTVQLSGDGTISQQPHMADLHTRACDGIVLQIHGTQLVDKF